MELAIGNCYFQMPFGCVCYEDKIPVTDREAHVVKVYNKNGEYLYEFGRRGPIDRELYHPTRLAVDKTGNRLFRT